jgi:TolA-binding protein
MVRPRLHGLLTVMCLAIGAGSAPMLSAQQAPAQTLAAPVEDPRLADLRAEVAALSASVADIRLEAVQSGAVASPGGSDLLARIAAVEAALTRLTAQSEAMQLRLARVIEDASNRIGDIEFRLAELEGADLATLTPPPALGAMAEAAASRPEVAGASQMTGFDQARALIADGAFRGALDLLETEAAALAADPDRIERAYLRGEALAGLGYVEASAQAYLDAFSAAPAHQLAPSALMRLGEMLGRMGAVVDACITLAEVGVRYPGLEHAATLEAAARARSALGCS